MPVREVESGRLVRTLVGHTGPVMALAVLLGGLVASGSQDMTVVIWRVANNVDVGQCNQFLIPFFAPICLRSAVSRGSDMIRHCLAPARSFSTQIELPCHYYRTCSTEKTKLLKYMFTRIGGQDDSPPDEHTHFPPLHSCPPHSHPHHNIASATRGLSPEPRPQPQPSKFTCMPPSIWMTVEEWMWVLI